MCIGMLYGQRSLAEGLDQLSAGLAVVGPQHLLTFVSRCGNTLDVPLTIHRLRRMLQVDRENKKGLCWCSYVSRTYRRSAAPPREARWRQAGAGNATQHARTHVYACRYVCVCIYIYIYTIIYIYIYIYISGGSASPLRKGGEGFEPPKGVLRLEREPPSPGCQRALQNSAKPSGKRPSSEVRTRASAPFPPPALTRATGRISYGFLGPPYLEAPPL